MTRTMTIRLGAVLLAAFAFVGTGCMARSTGSTRVGGRTRKLFNAGIDTRIYEPGSTHFFVPFLSDWHTFDIKLQNLEMTWHANRGDRGGDDSMAFKTIDGTTFTST